MVCSKTIPLHALQPRDQQDEATQQNSHFYRCIHSEAHIPSLLREVGKRCSFYSPEGSRSSRFDSQTRQTTRRDLYPSHQWSKARLQARRERKRDMLRTRKTTEPKQVTAQVVHVSVRTAEGQKLAFLVHAESRKRFFIDLLEQLY